MTAINHVETTGVLARVAMTQESQDNILPSTYVTDTEIRHYSGFCLLCPPSVRKYLNRITNYK